MRQAQQQAVADLGPVNAAYCMDANLTALEVGALGAGGVAPLAEWEGAAGTTPPHAQVYKYACTSCVQPSCDTLCAAPLPDAMCRTLWGRVNAFCARPSPFSTHGGCRRAAEPPRWWCVTLRAVGPPGLALSVPAGLPGRSLRGQ